MFDNPWDLMMMFGYGRPRHDNEIRLEFKFDSITDFYESCLTPDKTAWNEKMYNYFLNSDSPWFRGLTLKEILESKYSYQPGIAKLEKVKEDLLLDGASTFKNKWDEVDGEEMSMERMYDEMPFMMKRVRKHGFLNGKFVKIYVNLSENAHITHEELINKTYTATSLIDYLESIGYRTEVYTTLFANNLGTYKGQYVGQTYIEIPIKKWDENVNVSLMITTLSPWLFRYWSFLLESGHMITNNGMGEAKPVRKKSELGEIYINHGECLDKQSSDEFINKIKNMYDQTTEENIY